MHDKALKSKLLWKDDNTPYYCLHLPPALHDQFQGENLEEVLPTSKKAPIEYIMLFVTTSAELQKELPKVLPRLVPNAKCWIAFPKKTAGIPTDLSREESWQIVLQMEFATVASIAINAEWTALRIRPAGEVNSTRSSEQPVEGIDMKNRVVTPPNDLQAMFTKQPAAQQFFNTLSFTNKKEYVVWITSAKKAETREQRLLATIDKLLAGRKNPSDKA
ncbi:bacteriocin resistance YdeI/OmpD-like protein [Chitinophaga skermanii]|uniref:Bacteriocin resistance YdeI/OmpD-like protein n=2 Tax=Chitinophaga skermanii TaxID=331697 RepID=A0A327Q8N0_9BACT|nr:bacteriocin resistance YdeI/OmpD-like protein [Chitinophaga skermanii]